MRVGIVFVFVAMILFRAGNMVYAGSFDLEKYKNRPLHCANWECVLERGFQNIQTNSYTDGWHTSPSPLWRCLENGKCDTDMDEEFSQIRNQIQLRMEDLDASYKRKIYTELLCFAWWWLLGWGVWYGSESALSWLLTFYVGSTICRYGVNVLQ